MPIRPANAADIPAIIKLERGTPTAAHWSEEQYLHLFRCDPRVATRRMALVIEEAPGENSLQDKEQKIVLAGFLVAQGLGAEWEIENLVVDEAARRQGLGKRLVDELMSQARSAGAQSVYLEVRESNRAARALYESAGFAMSGRRERYYAAPSDDAILYYLSLG
ncbi:MAG: ribosomal protein S18-alanine N-acetyltransferase [Candidatus Sulfotelmatobacter sp.]